MKTNTTKAVICIEVEIEKPVPDIAGEVCRRIVMHPDIQNAKVVATSRLEYQDEPPQPRLRDYIGAKKTQP